MAQRNLGLEGRRTLTTSIHNVDCMDKIIAVEMSAPDRV
jgi:hypothetical protein